MNEQELAVADPVPDSDGNLERELLKQLKTGRAGLPVLPQVAGLALRLAADRNANVAELARLVETDPPIAARFLSVANSALYFRGFVIGSTQAAIVRLGLARTRDLLFQVVYSNTTVGLKRFQSEVRVSFERSVSCAIATRVASQVLGMPLELSYMCGLLHDIKRQPRIGRMHVGVVAVLAASVKRMERTVLRLVRVKCVPKHVNFGSLGELAQGMQVGREGHAARSRQ